MRVLRRRRPADHHRAVGADRIAAVIAAAVTLAGCGAGAPSGSAPAEQVFAGPATARLAEAAASGNARQVADLVTAGADPDATGDRGVTVLEWAMLHRSTTGFAALLDAGADPEEPAIGGDPVILMAAQATDPAYLRILLAHHVDPSRARGRSGRTPLMAAAGPATQRQFALLLAAGADPNRTDRVGNTALFTAGYAQMLQLLRAGADPTIRNRHGDTFQTMLNLTPPRLLNDRAKAQVAAVRAWLTSHGVPLQPRS